MQQTREIFIPYEIPNWSYRHPIFYRKYSNLLTYHVWPFLNDDKNFTPLSFPGAFLHNLQFAITKGCLTSIIHYKRLSRVDAFPLMVEEN